MRNDDTAHGAGRTDNAQNPLFHPDLAEAGRFLSLLDETADSFTFQTFDDDKVRKDRRLAFIRHGTLEQHTPELTRANREGCGVFVMVQAGDGLGRKNENVIRIRAVFIEDDGGGKQPPVEPHMTIESSPGKYHHYFLVDGLTIEEFRAVQERLVQNHGSDPNAKDQARVLRLPGFYHLKDPTHPHRVCIVHESGAVPYPRDEILRVFPPVERCKPTPYATSNGKVPEGKRNAHLTSQAGAMRRRGMSESAMLAALLVENKERCDPPLDDTEVESIARSISKYPPHQNQDQTEQSSTKTSGDEADPAPDQNVLDELLHDLPAKLVDDPGYVFKPDVLRALALLDENDGQAFDAIYRQCKANGVRMADFNRRITETRAKLREEREQTRKQSAGEAANSNRIGQYEIINGAIHRHKKTPDGDDVAVKLCNFNAQIVGEVMRDDGASVDNYFVIEGKRANGDCLGRTETSFAEFTKLNWVTQTWGNLACIEAGMTNRDHLRAAIQQLSGDVERRVIYGHTGWRFIEGEYRYLHSAGALGITGNRTDIEVETGAGKMSHYLLPNHSTDCVGAVRASLRLLDIAPKNPAVGSSLICAIYRAPLAECASVDVSLFFGGLTGTHKTEVSALALQHFGADFLARAIPGNWLDTPTDLEMKAHAAKDAVFVIDDFKPNGRPKQEADRLHSLADRIFRGVGNGVGRGRRTATLKQRPDYPARGFVIASGEDLPKGHSCRARLLIVEVRRGDVDKVILTELQRAGRSGLLAQAMAAYIAWLAPRLPELKTTLRDRLITEREAAIQAGLNGDHDRVPDNVAQCLVGASTFAEFAAHVGAVDDASVLFESIKRAIYQIAAAQGEHLSDQDDVQRFFSLLGSSLVSHRVHVVKLKDHDAPPDPHVWGWRFESSAQGGHYAPGGNFVGWHDSDRIYLDAGAAYAAAVSMARDQGESFTITQNSLWNRLGDRGLLLERKAEKRKDGTPYFKASCQKKINGKIHSGLICVAVENFIGHGGEKKSDTSDTEPPEATAGAGSSGIR